MFYGKKCKVCGKALEIAVNMIIKVEPNGKTTWLCNECAEKELLKKGILKEV